MDIEAADTPPAITLLILLIVIEEAQPTKLLVLVSPTKTWLTVIKVVDEEEPDVVGLPMAQAMVKVLLATIGLLPGEVVGKIAGQAMSSMCGATVASTMASTPGEAFVTYMMASSRAYLLVGVCSLVMVGNNNQPHGLAN